MPKEIVTSTAISRIAGRPRDTRLSLLVSEAEAEKIALAATTAGQSVRAFLRDRALSPLPAKDNQEAETLDLLDKIIDDMSANVENALGELNAALKRMD